MKTMNIVREDKKVETVNMNQLSNMISSLFAECESTHDVMNVLKNLRGFIVEGFNDAEIIGGHVDADKFNQVFSRFQYITGTGEGMDTITLR